MIQPAVHIVYSFGFFGLTVSLVSLLGNLRRQFRDGLILQENAYFNQNVIGGGYFGFPVEGVKLFPCFCGVGDSPAK